MLCSEHSAGVPESTFHLIIHVTIPTDPTEQQKLLLDGEAVLMALERNVYCLLLSLAKQTDGTLKGDLVQADADCNDFDFGDAAQDEDAARYKLDEVSAEQNMISQDDGMLDAIKLFATMTADKRTQHTLSAQFLDDLATTVRNRRTTSILYMELSDART